MAATLSFSPFRVTARDTVLSRVLATPAGAVSSFYHANYDVAPDGRSFVFLGQEAESDQGRVIVVHDWKDELRARLSARGGS